MRLHIWNYKPDTAHNGQFEILIFPLLVQQLFQIQISVRVMMNFSNGRSM